MKRIFWPFLLLLGLLAFPVSASAQVLINEFSAGSNDDWVEVINNGSAIVDLSAFVIRDSTESNKKVLGGQLSPGAVLDFDFVNYLNNNDADAIKLLQVTNGQEVLVDSIKYGSNDSVCFPSSSGSVGRVSDGGNTIDRFATSSRGQLNGTPTLDPCPPQATPTPSPSASATPTPTPTATPVATKSPTPKPSPTKSPTPKSSSAPVAKNNQGDGVLGLREGLSESPPPSSAPTESTGTGSFPIAAVLFVAGGGTLMGLGALSYQKQKKSGYTG